MSDTVSAFDFGLSFDEPARWNGSITQNETSLPPAFEFHSHPYFSPPYDPFHVSFKNDGSEIFSMDDDYLVPLSLPDDNAISTIESWTGNPGNDTPYLQTDSFVPSHTSSMPSAFHAQTPSHHGAFDQMIEHPEVHRAYDAQCMIQQWEHKMDHRSEHLEITSNESPSSPPTEISWSISDMFGVSLQNNADPVPESMPNMRKKRVRFLGDMYAPIWISGSGSERAGWCRVCPSWHDLRSSGYWYHLHFTHGVSCATGKRFTPPIDIRRSPTETGELEVNCSKCRSWLVVGKGANRCRTAYFRHAYRCHTDGRRVSTSVSPRRPKNRSMIHNSHSLPLLRRF